MRAAIVGKLHGWEWNAPLSVFQGPDGEIVIGGGPPSQDKAAAMETRRNMEREAVMLLKYSASTGLLGLQFAEGGSPPRAYWDAGAGFRAIESGRFLGIGELAVYDGRPVFAKASDFDTWLGKLSISSGGDMLAAFGSVKGPDAPKPTIAAERRCQSWLEEQMRAGPQTKAKPNYQVDACSKYNLSIRAFLRAWDAIAPLRRGLAALGNHSGRIDTPINRNGYFVLTDAHSPPIDNTRWSKQMQDGTDSTSAPART